MAQTGWTTKKKNKFLEALKQAASLILLEDDLGKMAEAVAMGRKIYANLKKAIQYILSIHIPIILTVFCPWCWAGFIQTSSPQCISSILS
nr:hypothetical protein [Botryobacter ruber]